MTKKEKLATRLGKEDEYAGFYTSDEIDALFRDVVSCYIDPGKCQACMTCARKCPVGAIVSAKKQIHVIDQEKCIKCGTCYEACQSRFSAVRKIFGEPVPPTIPEEERNIIRKIVAK